MGRSLTSTTAMPPFLEREQLLRTRRMQIGKVDQLTMQRLLFRRANQLLANASSSVSTRRAQCHTTKVPGKWKDW